MTEIIQVKNNLHACTELSWLGKFKNKLLRGFCCCFVFLGRCWMLVSLPLRWMWDPHTEHVSYLVENPVVSTHL